MSSLDCSTCQESMVDAYGGELAPDARQAFEAHLVECTACRELWQDYQDLHTSVGVWAREQQASPQSAKNILEAADAKLRRGPKISLHPWWKVLLSPPALAAATLLLVAGIGLYSQRWLGEPVGFKTSPPSNSASPEKAALPEARPRQTTTPAVPVEFKKDLAKKPAAKPPIPPLISSPARLEGLGITEFAQPAPAPQNEAQRASETEMKAFAPPSMTESTGPAAAPATGMKAKASAATGQMQAEKEETLDKTAADAAMEPDREQAQTPVSLLNSAKKKMEKKDYSGALKDLKKAQEIQDSAEVRKLIRECQKNLAPPP